MLFETNRSYLASLPRFAQDPAHFQTLLTTESFRQKLLDLISKAQTRIYITALYLQEDEAGAQILDALYAARARCPDLDIRVFVDWHRAQRGLIGAGAQAGNAAWYQRIRFDHELNVPIYGVPVQTRELFGVLHLKGFIFDDTVVYSGASLNNVYLNVGDRYRYDRYQVIKNSALADSMVNFLQTEFLNSSAVYRLDLDPIPSTKQISPDIRQLRQRLKVAQYATHHAQDEVSGLGITPVVGVGKRNSLNRLIIKLLGAAKQHVQICTPYFNLPRTVIKEINRLLQKGVKVDIIVGEKKANDFYIPESEPFKTIGALPYLYETHLRRFAKLHQLDIHRGQLNLMLWNDPGHSYHLKGIWVDDDYILLTGNNLNPRAFSLDLENALLIHDPKHELKEQLQQEKAEIAKNTTRIAYYRELETVLDYPPPVKKLLTRLSRFRADRLISRLL
ncbi:CDP-diacylglycerol--serine O-phosphatidyltransferase [Janthinobacterium sp. B9-8]|uniref:CDP-diacylglycerol--serine O-phosphatidyltransferase n=1 Tax=Janthinobacterium sp. B9-8 TaxID=1236179 RepID=UPI00069A7EA6|nr:CDP-diacylglycerol--serine O-phosphatidyltransferase [Janthinobacterium sp. B9-8]AMC36061.1 phosphatidylserine synthase [Janthinobacterium sp. B9-8]